MENISMHEMNPEAASGIRAYLVDILLFPEVKRKSSRSGRKRKAGGRGGVDGQKAPVCSIV